MQRRRQCYIYNTFRTFRIQRSSFLDPARIVAHAKMAFKKDLLSHKLKITDCFGSMAEEMSLILSKIPVQVSHFCKTEKDMTIFSVI